MAQTIEKLKEKLNKVKDRHETYTIEHSIATKRLSKSSSKMNSLKYNIMQREGIDKEVTDHARVRYMERVLGVDMFAIDKEILEEKNHQCRRVGNTITTIIANDDWSGEKYVDISEEGMISP